MEISTLNVIISAVAGSISGAIVSLVAPWVKWAISKKEKRHNRRKELIDQWRSAIESPDFDKREFVKSPLYPPLRERLSDNTRQRVENVSDGPMVGIVSEGGIRAQSIKEPLSREISRIEKDWGLI